jgi:hypothetical protein
VSEISGDQTVSYRRGKNCIDSCCVEVGRLDDGRVVLRSSRAPQVRPTFIEPDEWASFLISVKDGDFDTL